MSKIEVNKKNDWILIAILIFAIVFLVFNLNSCTANKVYSYKVLFEDGSVDYYELTYKVKKNSKSIEYNGETIIGVKDVELVK